MINNYRDMINHRRSNSATSSSIIKENPIKLKMRDIKEYKINNKEYKIKEKELYNILDNINNNGNKTTRNIDLIKNKNINIIKENLILALREDLNYQKRIYYKFIEYKNYTNKINKKYKKNYEDIFIYKENMKNKLKGFIDELENYNIKKLLYEKEKDTLLKTNQDIIKYKLIEQEKLKSELNKIEKDTESKINNLNNIKKLMKENKNNNNYLINNNNDDISIKYKNLVNDYNNLLKKYKYYNDLELKKRKYNLNSNDNIFIDYEINLKLQEDHVKNNYLKSVIENIKNQMNEIGEQKEKNKEKEELVKLFGKKAASKLNLKKSNTSLKHSLYSKSFN